MTTNINGLVVFGAIEQKWLSFGRENGLLGYPLSNEVPTFDGQGRFQNFQRGIVSWNPHPEMGAHVVWGLIGERWLQMGREQFGYPLTDETPTADGHGRFNHFRAFRPDGSLIGESSIFWSPETGAHEIYGAIRDKWASMDWDRSSLGYPVRAERDRSDGPGREQQFQHGRIVWSPATGAIVDPNAIHPVVHLLDHGGYIQVGGTGFTSDSHVSIFYSYRDAFGLKTNDGNPLVNTTSSNGSFSGATIQLTGSGSIAYINVKVVDDFTQQFDTKGLRGDA